MLKSRALQIVLNSILCDIVFQAESEEAQPEFCGPARPRLPSTKHQAEARQQHLERYLVDGLAALD